MNAKNSPPCPCGAPHYTACCGRFHSGDKPPANARELMQSRYSAYVMDLRDYLLQTWHASHRPESHTFQTDSAQTRWLGLAIKRFSPIDETHAEVEFVARYKPAGSGKAERLHETSRFIKEDNRWFYVDGDIHGQK